MRPYRSNPARCLPLRLKGVCDFLGEEYSPSMVEYHRQPTAQARGMQRDHALLAQVPTDVHIGIYKPFLTLREQRIFAALAGESQKSLGYDLLAEANHGNPASSGFRQLGWRERHGRPVRRRMVVGTRAVWRYAPDSAGAMTRPERATTSSPSPSARQDEFVVSGTLATSNCAPLG